MADSLNIIVKALLDEQSTKGILGQIDKIQEVVNKSPLKFKIEVDDAQLKQISADLQKVTTNLTKTVGSNVSGKNFINSDDIENRIQRINNSLERLKINKDTVFADTRVSSSVDALKAMEDQFRNGEISSKDYALQMDNVRTKVAQVSGELRNVNHDGYTFSSMVELAAKKIAIWAVSTNLVYGSLKQLESGISYVVDLDNALNQIRIVTGDSQQQVEQLAQSYNKLAQQMSVSTKEVAEQAVDLYRQGLQGVDVDERMQSIIKYAKISSISLADANKIITATMNATGESAQKVIDVFSYLGDATASGADEIGEAMQKVASMNDGIGVSMEKAASWIAVISSKTREGASQIGTSLKSVESRYASIKATGFNSEDATNINQVTKALTEAGVQATTADGQLRNFADVIDDLGKKYQGLDDKTKNYVMTTLGGTYQMNRLRALMDGYSQSIDLYNNSLSQAGIANQKFNIWQESTAAKMDKLKASWENFWQSSVDSGVIKGALDTLNTLMNSFGNMPTVLGIAASALLLWKGTMLLSRNEQKQWVGSLVNVRTGLVAFGASLEGLTAKEAIATIATKTFGAAFNSLKLAFLSNPIGVALTVITTAYSAFELISQGISQSAEKSKQAFNDLIGSISQLKQETAEIPNLISSYEELSAKTLKTADEKQKLADVTSQLSQLFPQAVSGLNNEGQAASVDVEYIKQLTEQKKELLKVQQQQLATTFSTTGDKDLSQLQKQQQKIKELTDNIATYKKAIADINSGKEDRLTITPDGSVIDNLDQYQKMLKGASDQKTKLLGNTQALTNSLATEAFAFAQSTDSLKDLSQGAILNLVDNIGKGSGSIADLQAKMQTLANSGFDQKIADYSKQLADMGAKGASAKEQQSLVDAAVKELTPTLKSAGYEANDAAKYIQNLFTATAQASQSVQQTTFSLEDFAKATTDSQNNLKQYNQILSDMASGQKMSTEEAFRLITANNNLSKAISVHNGVVTIDKNAVENLRQSEINEMNSKIDSEINKTKATIDGTNARIKAINAEINAQNSLAQSARAAAIAEQAAKNGEDPSIAELRGLHAYAGTYLGNEQLGIEQAALTNAQSYLNQLNALKGSYSSPSYGVSGGGSSGSKSGGGSSSKSSSTAEQRDYQDVTQSIINQIQAQSQLTEAKNKTIQAQIDEAKNQNNINLAMQKTKELMAGQKTEISQLQQANTKLMAMEDQIKHKGYGAVGWIDANGNATQKYYDQYNKASASAQKAMAAELAKLQAIQKQINDNSAAIADLNQQWKDNQNAIADNVIETIKNAYEQEKQMALDSIDAQINALDKQAEAEKKVIDAKLKEIDLAEQQTEYAEKLADAQKNAQDIQNQINRLSLDDSMEAKAKRADLQKQLDDQNKSIDDMQRQHDVDTRKQNLQDQEDAYQQDIDNQKTALEQKKTDIEYYYNEILNDDAKFAKLRQDIISGNVKDIQNLLNGFASDFSKVNKAKASEIGESYTALLTLIQQVNTAANSIKPSVVVKKGSVEEKALKAEYGNSINYIYGDSNQFVGKDRYATNKMYQDYLKKLGISPINTVNLASLDTGGLTPAWGNDGKLAVLHENELVFPKMDTGNLLKVFDITKNILSNFKLPDFNNIKFNTPVASGGGDIYMEFHIDKVVGTEQGAKSFASFVQNELKKIGK